MKKGTLSATVKFLMFVVVMLMVLGLFQAIKTMMERNEQSTDCNLARKTYLQDTEKWNLESVEAGLDEGCPTKVFAVKGMDEKEIKNLIANQMLVAWNEWGSQYKHYAKDTDHFCHPYAIFNFSDKIKMNEFSDFLNERKVSRSTKSYAEALSGGFAKEFKKDDVDTAIDEFTTEGIYGVVFIYSEEVSEISDWLSGTQGYRLFSGVVDKDEVSSSASDVLYPLGFDSQGGVSVYTGAHSAVYEDIDADRAWLVLFVPYDSPFPDACFISTSHTLSAKL